jgi:hypothetical protein
MARKVLIRTVTNYFVGELVDSPEPGFWALKHASWVPETGRFSQALRTGQFAEVEPYPPDDIVLVSAGAIVDISPFNHGLPDRVK